MPIRKMGMWMVQGDDGAVEVNLSQFTCLLRAGDVRFALKLAQLNELTDVLGKYCEPGTATVRLSEPPNNLSR